MLQKYLSDGLLQCIRTFTFIDDDRLCVGAEKNEKEKPYWIESTKRLSIGVVVIDGPFNTIHVTKWNLDKCLSNLYSVETQPLTFPIFLSNSYYISKY